MAIKNFKSFNEAVEMTDQDKEELKWYLDNGYIQDDKFKTPEELLNFIKNNISEAFNKMTSRNRVPIKNARIEIDGSKDYYIRLYSDPLSNFGTFKNCIESAHFSFFSGKKIEFIFKNNLFLFKPAIWTSLVISYQAHSGGSNGLDYRFNLDTQFESNDLWYNILLNVFETKKEMLIRKKPMLGSKKLKNLGDKTGIFSEDEEILPPVSLS